ncbi:hypothetical protein ALC57_12159 [Trachymyrmex cornetzi]|uniref:Uncharacterized protein n=1 Tax=Trachymyrmex cornetzi TaxID=471704 RepID=A0A195DS31_9HYME|nr:hypothetical protein ALC57_12159 [Trachymyrmex cornetzi]
MSGRLGRGPRRWLNECGEIGEPEAKGARSFTIRLVRRIHKISSVSQPLTLRGTRNLLNIPYSTSKKKKATVKSKMDSCDWTRMGNEDGEGMAGADPAASWQQCYTWCTPYSHSHPHHHPHHPRQYQGSQYQQLPESVSAATNASTHYPSSQQHHLQLQNTQPPPLDQQQHFHPIRGQGGLRRAVSYDESEKDRIEGSRKRGGLREANETMRGVTTSREMVEAAEVEESEG